MISKYAGIILGFGAGEIIILFIKVFLTLSWKSMDIDISSVWNHTMYRMNKWFKISFTPCRILYVYTCSFNVR